MLSLRVLSGPTTFGHLLPTPACGFPAVLTAAAAGPAPSLPRVICFGHGTKVKWSRRRECTSNPLGLRSRRGDGGCQGGEGHLSVRTTMVATVQNHDNHRQALTQCISSCNPSNHFATMIQNPTDDSIKDTLVHIQSYYSVNMTLAQLKENLIQKPCNTPDFCMLARLFKQSSRHIQNILNRYCDRQEAKAETTRKEASTRTGWTK